MDLETLFDLFGTSILAALLAGLVGPLLGVQLFLRRTSFLGLALPQFAACGVAAGYVAWPWFAPWLEPAHDHSADSLGAIHPVGLGWNVAWAAGFTLIGMAWLALAARNGRGSETARVAGAFAVTTSATVLLAHYSPWGADFVGGLVEGQLLTITPGELGIWATAVLAAGALLLWLRAPLELVAFDRDSARVQGLAVVRLDLGLGLCTGLLVALGALTVGPMVLFGLLVLPPLAARAWARSMGQLLCLSSLTGVLATLLGLWASLQQDLPLGPCVVLAAAVLALPSVLSRRT